MNLNIIFNGVMYIQYQIAKSGGYKIVDNWWSNYTCKWNIHQLSAISYPPLLAICKHIVIIT